MSAIASASSGIRSRRNPTGPSAGGANFSAQRQVAAPSSNPATRNRWNFPGHILLGLSKFPRQLTSEHSRKNPLDPAAAEQLSGNLNSLTMNRSELSEKPPKHFLNEFAFTRTTVFCFHKQWLTAQAVIC
jgi:hypothetical protein